MTAQGIMNGAGSAMNAVFSGFPAAGSSVKGMQDTSFEQFMETSQSGKKDASGASAKETGVKEASVTGKNVKERAKELFSGESKVKETPKAQAEETVEVSEEETEAVSTLLVQVKQVICETLDITEEQLTGAMEELGLTDSDLLDRGSLQQIFLNLNQAEPTEFLTNEELFVRFGELMQAVEQTVEASGMNPEDVQAILAVTEETADAVTDVKVHTETADVSTEQTEEENTEEVSNESVATKVSETTSEAKTETGNDGTEGNKATAKKAGERIVVSNETDADVKNVFIDALAKNAVTETGDAGLSAAAQVREIANQIMEQIKITISPEMTNMELQLNPEHLGRVNLTITEKEGMMTAQFTTQTEVAKEAIESQMSVLRETLQNQGIKVEAIEVTVSEFGFERDRQSEQSSNGEQEKRRRSGDFTVEDTEEAAPKMSDYLNVTDSSVDYSA